MCNVGMTVKTDDGKEEHYLVHETKEEDDDRTRIYHSTETVSYTHLDVYKRQAFTGLKMDETVFQCIGAVSKGVDDRVVLCNDSVYRDIFGLSQKAGSPVVDLLPSGIERKSRLLFGCHNLSSLLGMILPV